MQQEHNRTVEHLMLEQEFNGAESDGHSSLHVQHSRTADALRIRLPRHGAEGADIPHRVQMPEQEDGLFPGPCRSESSFQRVTEVTMPVHLEPCAHRKAPVSYAGGDPVHSRFVLAGGLYLYKPAYPVYGPWLRIPSVIEKLAQKRVGC